MTHSELVDATVNNGIPPLYLRYTPFLNSDSKLPCAFRTSTVIRSLDLGVLTEYDYSFAADSAKETGIRLAEWNIREALRVLDRLSRECRAVEFISVRCPASLAAAGGLFARLFKILEEFPDVNPAGLCLEFPQSLLYIDEEKAHRSIVDCKLLHVKTMVSGCGADDCPVTRLLKVPVDYALLTPEATSLIDNRNKADVLPAFIRYLSSMRVQVLAEGVKQDSQISTLQRLDVRSVILSPDYQGKIEKPKPEMVEANAVTLAPIDEELLAEAKAKASETAN